MTDVVWWSLPWKQEVAGAQNQWSSSNSWPLLGLEMLHHRFNGPASSLGDVGGRACLPSLAQGLLHVLWWHRPSCHTLSRASTGVCPTWQTCSVRREWPCLLICRLTFHVRCPLQKKKEFTPRFDGCGGGHDDPNGCGDTRGRAYGSHDRRSKKQVSSCGGRIKFCLSRGGTSLRCAVQSAPGATKTSHFVGQWEPVEPGPVQSQLKRGPAWIARRRQHLKVRSPGIWLSFEVMSRPREWIPRLHVQGGSDTKSAGISEHGDGVEVVDATLQKLLLILSAGHSAVGGSRLFGRSESQGRLRHQGGCDAVSPFLSPRCFQRALKVSLQAIIRGCEQHSDLRVMRG